MCSGGGSFHQCEGGLAYRPKDVVAVARQGDLAIPEVDTDFGAAEGSIHRWTGLGETSFRGGT